MVKLYQFISGIQNNVKGTRCMMKRKHVIKKCLPLLLTLVFMLSFLPVTAAAEEMPWAADAVNTLNRIYGPGTFSAENSPVTVGGARGLLTGKLGYPDREEIVGVPLGAVEANLTRLQAAQIVFRIYGLAESPFAQPFGDCDDPQVATLRFHGVALGFGDGTFRPEAALTHAEFAVIVYRTLAKAGGLEGGRFTHILPGAYGYDEFAYLNTRGLLSTEIDPKENIETATVTIFRDGTPLTYQGKKEIWNFWTSLLEALPPGSDRTVTWSVYDQVQANTVQEVVMKIAAEDRAAPGTQRWIFSDVDPVGYFYDGIMYLFNKAIVNGNGAGEFMPNNTLNRGELAALVCRINGLDQSKPAEGVTVTDVTYDHWSYNSVTQAIAHGYMIYADEHNFNPLGIVTREETVHALFRSYGEYADNHVNLAVLDRFADQADIGESYRTAMAYAVSAGIIRGTAEGTLMPDRPITRGEFGVVIARVMAGLDTSKMHDYDTAVKEVLE